MKLRNCFCSYMQSVISALKACWAATAVIINLDLIQESHVLMDIETEVLNFKTLCHHCT